MDRMPTAADFDLYRVTNPKQSEIVRQSLYDTLLYPTAGQTQLSFFSTPVGGGVTTASGATVGTAKTQFDTNLELGNTLPSGKAFLIESIEVHVTAGLSAAANTFTLAVPSVFAAVAAAAVAGQVNDVASIIESGMLELNILSKNYLRETPLKKFPPKCAFGADMAIASNSATTAEVATVNASAKGRAYFIEPNITLQPAVNFEVLLKWPGVVATPSGFNAKVQVVLDGYFMRATQ